MLENMASNLIIAILRQMNMDPEQLKTEVLGHVNSFKKTFDDIDARLARIEKHLDIPVPTETTEAAANVKREQPNPQNGVGHSVTESRNQLLKTPVFPGSEGLGNYQGNAS